MIELPEIVPADEIKRFKTILIVDDCPAPIAQFIDRVALELGDFEQVNVEATVITGHELHLANITHIGKDPVKKDSLYNVDVPVLQAVNHKANMHRIYRRQGKQGLMNYCAVKSGQRAVDSLKKVLAEA